MKNFSAVTTFNLEKQPFGFEMLESYFKFWPDDCKMYAFLEEFSRLDRGNRRWSKKPGLGPPPATKVRNGRKTSGWNPNYHAANVRRNQPLFVE